jgi:hypothetical protein
MQQNSLLVSSFDITLELSIISDASFYKSLRTHPFWHEYIPNFSLGTSGAVTDRWNITQGDECTFDLTKNHIQADSSHHKQIIVILESVFERYRQEKGLYTLHGSAIAKDNYAVGFIGNLSGIGKSSMGAYAAQHGWKWIADEKFTINNNRIVGGTSGILNDNKTRKAASGFSPEFNSDTGYDLKLLCSPIATNEDTPVRHDWDKAKKLWIYNDETSRDIRQVNGVLHGFSESLQSFDSPQLAHKRNDIVTLLANSVDGSFIRGTKTAILDTIKEIITTQ